MDKVKPFLGQYLEEHGRNLSEQKFQCPNAAAHKNNDLTPSCGFYPDQDHFYCFACQSAGDIFKAATFLENRPSFGTEFITDNVLYLASKYKVEYVVEEANTEQQKAKQILELLDLAAEMLHLSFSKDNEQVQPVKDYVKKRGWEPLIKEFKLGWGRYDKLIAKLREKGFSEDILKDSGIMNRALIDNRLIIPIHNHYGRVVSLASRAIDPNDKIKYINGKTSLVYKKDAVLFNMHRAKASSKVYVVEGYADVFTMHLKGITCAVAVCTNMMTEAQYEVMVKCGTQKAVLCMDSDEVNKDVYERLLNNVIKDKKDIKIYIKELSYSPKEWAAERKEGWDEPLKDPDSIIRFFGVKYFMDSPELSVFHYRLDHFKRKPHDAITRDNLLSTILKEESAMERESLCKEVAKGTEFSFDSIREELTRLESSGYGGTGMMMSDIIQERGMTLESINQFEEWAWSRKGDLLGLHMGYPILTRRLDGLQQGLYLVGGKANVGKTAFCQQLCLQILFSNPGKAHVLYFTIDDDIRKMIPRLIASQCGLPINVVSNPVQKIQKDAQHDEETIARLERQRETAVARLRELSDSLYIRDASHGKTLEYMVETARKHKFIAGQKQLVVFIDNLHKIRLGNSKEKGKEKFTIISEAIKEMANQLDIPVICTAELKKSQDVDHKGQAKRPTEEDLKETADLAYDADVVFMVYNEMHHLKGNAKLKHLDTDMSQALPVLELIVAKNKVSDFKSTLLYKFWPALARIEEASLQEHTTRQF